MKEQPILGYDWEMGHEEIKLEIGTYYTGKGLYGMLAKEDGVWESFSDRRYLPFERSDVHEAFIQDFGSKEKLKFIQNISWVNSSRARTFWILYLCKVAFNLKRLEELDPEDETFYKDHPELEEKSQVPKRKTKSNGTVKCGNTKKGVMTERPSLAYFHIICIDKMEVK